jgi:hypothetical protein
MRQPHGWLIKNEFLYLPSGACWVGRIGDIDEDDARFALISPRHGTYSIDKVRLWVGNDVVGASHWKTFVVAS